VPNFGVWQSWSGSHEEAAPRSAAKRTLINFNLKEFSSSFFICFSVIRCLETTDRLDDRLIFFGNYYSLICIVVSSAGYSMPLSK